MGKKRTDVTLYIPSTLSGQFERTIVVPKVCCRCLSEATEEQAISANIYPSEGATTRTLEVNFPFCEKCSKRINRRGLPMVIIGVPLAFFILFWIFQPGSSWGPVIFTFIVGLPLMLILGHFYELAQGVSMSVESLGPLNFYHITFSFENSKYASMFGEANKEINEIWRKRVQTSASRLHSDKA